VKDFSPQKHVNIEQVNLKTVTFRRNLVQILASYKLSKLRGTMVFLSVSRWVPG